MAKKAIVLAAGLGTRLRPLTGVTPKPLMPVWGEPMLARIVNLLRSWGVDDIVVNCHYLHEQVEAWCAANGCRASYEPEILGTGGVLNPLRDWIGDDEFYLVNGDIVVEGLDRYPFPPKTFETCEVGAEVIASCLVTVEGPRTIEVEPESGFVTNWKSEDAGFEGTFTYCGLALLKPAILDYVEPTGFSTIVQAYERAMMDGKFVRAVEPKDLMWTDAGTIATYIDLNRDGADNAFADFPQLKEAFAAVPSATGDIEFLGARGSDRCFFRKGAALAIVYDDSKRGENARYAGHAKWLKAQGVAVPEILADLPAIKTLVMEHVGSTDLLARLGKPGVDRIGSYLPVVEALAKFNAMREKEGAAMEADLRSRAKTVLSLVEKVEARSPVTLAEYRARLTEKMQEVLGQTNIDEGRILQEAAIYADRIAVDEETVRLRSHLNQLEQMLTSGGPIGRKLDFLLQEFNRESNTIGSKGNDLEQARTVVELKAELEKIREQTQNIE